jgi:hypothetical protein
MLPINLRVLAPVWHMVCTMFGGRARRYLVVEIIGGGRRPEGLRLDPHSILPRGVEIRIVP